MQDHSSFDGRHNMGSNPENRFCRLSVHCVGGRKLFSIYIDVDQKQQNECLMTPCYSKNTLVLKFETAYMYAIRRKEKIQWLCHKMPLLNSAECNFTMSSVSKGKLVYTEFTFAVSCKSKLCEK